jgi:hypothetical protein
MTPKHKAEELFDKMSTNNGDEYHHCTKYVAIQCALIAVDEIIDSEPQYEWSNDYWKNPNDFWQEVKREIANL